MTLTDLVAVFAGVAGLTYAVEARFKRRTLIGDITITGETIVLTWGTDATWTVCQSQR